MTYRLEPSLVNGRFGDPAVYVGFRYKARALLLDAGELSTLTPSQLRVVSDLFVSHAHFDHFAGFDQLLRTQLESDKELRVFGPTGIAAKIAHKLAGYSWNLNVRTDPGLSILVTEIGSSAEAGQTRFLLKNSFSAGAPSALEFQDGQIFEDRDILVNCAQLDHKLPSLGYAIREQATRRIDEDKLAALPLPRGRWLFRLRQALRRGLPSDTRIEIDQIHGFRSLGELHRSVVVEKPGRKICYITDCQFNEDNARRIIALAKDADTLFIESKFSAADADLARARYHLTTDQAGLLAARAGVRSVVPFHFSRRYRGSEQMMLEQVERALLRNRNRETTPAAFNEGNEQT